MAFFTEKTANLPRHFLNYYNAFSEHEHCLGGVAVLLKENSVRQTVRNRRELSRQRSVNNSVECFKISTAYVQPENLDGVKNIMKVLESCKEQVDDSKINDCIFFGNLIALHQYWGDSKSNCLGDEMVKIVNTYSILNNGEPNFIYGPIVSQYQHILTTDEYVELFTGAPNRGHLSVLVDFAVLAEKLKQRSCGWRKQIGSFGQIMLRLVLTKSIRKTTTPLHSGKPF